MKLNPQQELIVNNIFGAYLISAPVGTGKTSVLTERIAKAIENGVKPNEILALTFTNRAADEMKGRIKRRVDDKSDFDSLTISTFHAFCAYFIRSEAKNVGIATDFLILDEDEQLEVVKSIFNEAKKTFPEKPREVLNRLEEFHKYRLSLFQIDIGHKVDIKKINPEIIIFGEEYLKRLKEQNSFDFNELVLTVLEILFKNQDISKKWSERFRFIQLDEFQDTHLSEYLVIKELAKKHKNVALIGDIDQTIYSFRDSRPVFIASLFKEHFKPVKEFSLNINYRSNPELIKAFLSILGNMEEAKTKELNILDNNEELESNVSNKCIKSFKGYNFREEALWVVDSIKNIKKIDKSAKIAVLTRTNRLISNIAEVFLENKISFLTVDQYDFFKRQEVKDVFAHLKILFNKSDQFSVKRVMQRPPKNIGEETLEKIKKEGVDCGLNVSDFLNFKNYNFTEPFSRLISLKNKGRIIVLDTETTGINPAKDEIVQVYAREIINGKLGGEFHHYLKNKKSVASSFFVHKISDEFLEEKGEDPKKVLSDLKNFISDSVVVGHNVVFDLNMIKENCKRYKINIDLENYYDTLDISKRFLSLGSYKLSNIAKHLNFEEATHSADDDVAATVDLLLFLIEKLEKNSKSRELLWNKFKSKFINLSVEINNFEKQVDKMRPDDFLSFIWEKSGLDEYYKKDKNYSQRRKSFETLKTFFKNKDEDYLPNRTALHNLIHYSGLIKNVDFLGMDGGKIPVVTIHQVKGLEFDYVFLLGLNEGAFPFFRTDNMEEEKRLFYVALTRARKKVFLSYSMFNEYNYPSAKSRLISMIDDDFIENV